MAGPSSLSFVEFGVAKTYAGKFNGHDRTKLRTTKLLSEHCEALNAVSTAHLPLKLGIILGTSTAKCENSFSVLKNIM